MPEQLTEVLRFDVGPLSNVTRTEQGGIRVRASVARSGVMTYMRADGSPFREWVPPEEIEKADSLATLRDAPVTYNHPDKAKYGTQFVTPRNARQETRGHASGEPKVDTVAGEKHVFTDAVINDEELIGAIGAGLREVSAGRKVRMDFTSGVTPSGEKYDAIQRDIRYNHIAIVPSGRAGSTVALRLDALGNETFAPLGVEDGDKPRAEKVNTMKTIKIDGIDYPISTEAEVQAAFAATERQRVAMIAERDRAVARADAAEASTKELTEKLTKSEDPARIDAAVSARVSLHSEARKVLGVDAKLDGSDIEVKSSVIAKVFPAIKLDGKSGEYVDGIYAAAIAKHDATDPNDAIRAVVNPPKTENEKTDAKTEPKKPSWQNALSISKDA